MTSPALQSIGQTLRECCPGDFQRPVYVLDRPDTPAWRWDANMCGFCQCGLDLECQDVLERDGRWEGRGYAVVIDAAQHATDEQIVATAIHEFAHCLRQPQPKEFTEAERELAVQCGWDSSREPLIAFLRSIDNPSDVPQLAAFAGHDAQYIRGLCHLWYRWPGDVWPPSLNHSGGLVVMTSVFSYIERLERELVECRQIPIRTLLLAPPPDAFSELFRRDVERLTK